MIFVNFLPLLLSTIYFYFLQIICHTIIMSSDTSLRQRRAQERDAMRDKVEDIRQRMRDTEQSQERWQRWRWVLRECSVS